MLSRNHKRFWTNSTSLFSLSRWKRTRRGKQTVSTINQNEAINLSFSGEIKEVKKVEENKKALQRDEEQKWLNNLWETVMQRWVELLARDSSRKWMACRLKGKTSIHVRLQRKLRCSSG